MRRLWLATAVAMLVGRAPTSAGPLVQATIERLRGWRLEESTQRTNFTMTFDFEVTDDLSELSIDVRRFPERITIRGKPSLLEYELPPTEPPVVVKGHGIDR